MMSQTQIGIADMQCWVFRKAQKKWNLTPAECADVFRKYDLLGLSSRTLRRGIERKRLTRTQPSQNS